MTPGCRDPAIKLFGRTIPLPPVANTPPISGEEFSGEYDAKELSTKEDALESPNNNNNSSNINEKDHESSNSDEKSSPPSSSSASDAKIDQKAEEQAREAMESQEKQTKKPDKILPCPRCNSLDTKFCYFNNYNVNQPRHFCKHCQRYWTAGGTMRNIPVGAGRRKSKSSSSQYKHLTIPSTTLPTLKPNGTVLNFGADAPLCESMASVLNLAEKTSKSCSPNGVEKMVPFSCKLENGGEEHYNSSPEAKVQGFAAHQWPYPWSPIAIPIYPAAAYWGCAFAGAWNVPWLSAFPTDATASVSGPNSPTLGKHTRDGLVLSHSSNAEREETRRKSDPERCLWIPKTLRIDDPEEAAKSSIWSSIGIKNDKVDGVRGGGLFNAFRSKTEIKNHTAATSPAFHANPAALARSLNFQESS